MAANQDGSSPGITINGVPCTFHIEADGEAPAIVEQGNLDNGPMASILLKCDWKLRNLLRIGLLGAVGYANGTVNRKAPYSYPIAPFDIGLGVLTDRLVCTSVGEIRGIKWKTDVDGSATGLQGWGYYAEAIVPANFTVPLWQQFTVGTDAFGDASNFSYVVTKFKSSGEVFSPPSGSMTYNGGAFLGQALTDIHGAQIRTRQEITMTLVRFPIYPVQAITACRGCINSQPMVINGTNYPPHSVLFAADTTDPKPDPVNYGIVQDVELSFLANAPTQQTAGVSLDWSWFMDPQGVWVPVVLTGSNNPVFPEADFTQLFRPNIA